MSFKHKDLLGIQELTHDEIDLVLRTAAPFKTLFTRSIKKVPTLRGKTVAQLFYEPSTRTRTSFELAAARLSADSLKPERVLLERAEGRIARRYRAEPGSDESGFHGRAPLRVRRAGAAGQKRAGARD